MLSKKIQQALNKQINYELTAAYNYLAMSAWFEAANLAGFARWMRFQREEELKHAMKVFDFVNDRGGTVALDAITAPKADFKTPRDVFGRAHELEQANTRAIHALYALAVEEKDYATQSMLKWFIDEQVEEEKSTTEIEALLAMADDNRSALLILNEKLGQRASTD